MLSCLLHNVERIVPYIWILLLTRDSFFKYISFSMKRKGSLPLQKFSWNFFLGSFVEFISCQMIFSSQLFMHFTFEDLRVEKVANNCPIFYKKACLEFQQNSFCCRSFYNFVKSRGGFKIISSFCAYSQTSPFCSFTFLEVKSNQYYYHRYVRSEMDPKRISFALLKWFWRQYGNTNLLYMQKMALYGLYWWIDFKIP